MKKRRRKAKNRPRYFSHIWPQTIQNDLKNRKSLFGTLINNKYSSIYFNNIFNKIILLTQPQIKVLRSKIIKYLTITNLLKLSNLTLCNHNFQSQGKQIVPSLKTE